MSVKYTPGRDRRISLLLALYPLSLLFFTLFTLLYQPRVGIAGLALVFAPYLFAPLVLLFPIALLRGTLILRSALLAALIAYLSAYPLALNVRPAPATPLPNELRVLTWNVYVSSVSNAELHAAIAQYAPDIVALQEVDWRTLANDAALLERYPYHLISPDLTPPGMALLSTYPIRVSGVPRFLEPAFDMPRLMWAELDVHGTHLLVINAHPQPPRLTGGSCGQLRCYNRGPRDAQISAMREFVAAHLQPDRPLLLLGDLNVTEREPAFAELSAGLIDAHQQTGIGMGNSWRPAFVRWPVAAIRIDYSLSHGPITPVALTTDCTWRGSDHCLLFVRYTLGVG